MSTSDRLDTWDGEIDLKRWLETLIRYKWVVVAVTGAALVLGIVLNYAVLTPTYQTSASLALPSAPEGGRWGFSLPGYQGLASDPQVMAEINRRLGQEFSQERLPGHYTFQITPESRQMTMTAAASSEKTAFLLADTWVQVYSKEVEDRSSQQFTRALTSAQDQVDGFTPLLKSAKQRLRAFEESNVLSLNELRLAGIEATLQEQDNRFRHLSESLPLARSRVTVLEKLANGESLDSAVPLRAESGSTGGVNASGLSTPDKSSQSYSLLRRQMNEARLSRVEEELVSLESRLLKLELTIIPVYQARLDLLRDALAKEPKFLDAPDPPARRASHFQATEGSVPNPTYNKLNGEVRDTELRLAGNVAEREGVIAAINGLEEQVGELQLSLAQGQQDADLATQRLEAFREAGDLRRQIALNQAEADALAANALRLQLELKDLQQQVIRDKTFREELTSELASISQEYATATASLKGLQQQEPKLAALTRVNVLERPSLPATLVKPQRVRNIIISALIGIALGVSAVIFLDLSRVRGTPTGS